MVQNFNLAQMASNTEGNGAIILRGTVAGGISFQDAGVPDGNINYIIINPDTHGVESGVGSWNLENSQLARLSVTESTNSNNFINLSGSSQVFLQSNVISNSFFFGNNTSFDSGNSSTIRIVNPGEQLFLNSALVAIGANVSLQPTGLTVGNVVLNSILGQSGIFTGNTTANVTISQPGIVITNTSDIFQITPHEAFAGNSTSFTSIQKNQIVIGNTGTNTVINSTMIAFNLTPVLSYPNGNKTLTLKQNLTLDGVSGTSPYFGSGSATIGNGGNASIGVGAQAGTLVFISDNTNTKFGGFINAFNATTVLISTGVGGGNFVSGTPSSGQTGFFYDGGQASFIISNNTGGTVTYQWYFFTMG